MIERTMPREGTRRSGGLLVFESYCQALYGNQQYVLMLLDVCKQKTVPITLLCKEDGELAHTAIHRGHSVYVLSPGGLMSSHGRLLLHGGLWLRIKAFFALARYSLTLFHWLGLNQPDIVLCNNLRSLLTIGPAARMRGIPILWYVKGELESRMLARLGGILANVVAVNAKELKAPFQALLGKRKFNDMAVLPPIGLDYEALDSILREKSDRALPEARPFVFSYAGVITREKGVHILLEAFADLRDEGIEAGLWLIGTSDCDAYLEQLHKTCDERGVTENVHFMGWQSEAVKLMSQSDVFVLPSFTEGAPGVIVEAQACGVPVISTRVGGTPSLVSDGSSGLLVEPDNVAELKVAMQRLVEDSNLRERLSSEGFEQSRKKYAPEVHLKKLMMVAECML